MRRSADFEKLYKHVEVSIVYPEGFRKRERKTFRAGPKRGYSAKNIKDIVDEIIENLDKRFPHWNFRLVPCGANKFNFVYAGLRSEEAKAA